MPEIIAGEAAICPISAQVLIGLMVLVYGPGRFAARAAPGPQQRWIARHIEQIPWPDELPEFALSDQDLSVASHLAKGRRIERAGCARGLGINFIY